MMLKMTLFAYSRKVFSGRKIQQMAEESIPMKWLIGDPDVVPSYRTIDRFRTDEQTTKHIALMYLQFRQSLIDNNLLSDEAIFIDGTKILADANKYSFVWRKSIENFECKLDQKTRAL
ncbi:transposase, partial [Lentilactobacillus sunkii]|uniref:transposase n=1 Tax=Lentilactobacillus sunkii TaxID=481719 RepID=UPI0030B7F8EF